MHKLTSNLLNQSISVADNAPHLYVS